MWLARARSKPSSSSQLPQQLSQVDAEGKPLPTVDELSLVGYPGEITMKQAFEKTGSQSEIDKSRHG